MTREEAIEIFKRLKENAPNEMHLETIGTAQELFDMAIQALSQEPCDDAISREAVIEILGDYGCTNREGLIFKDIRALPPVPPKSETVTEFADRCRECGAKYGKLLEQKSGKWIETEYHRWRCSVCREKGMSEWDNIHDVRTNFCPDCGAKMVEPQESEDKE